MTGADPRVVVRRSRRRTRSVSAHRDGETTYIAIPARFSVKEEAEWVAKMVARLDAKEARRRPSDEALLARAATLAAKYLPQAPAPSSVRWSASQQKSRWGSCTLDDRSIRLSTRLRGMPEWVVDYVLLHELAHLVVAGHGPDFWALVEAYPRTTRARGFLDGVSYAQAHAGDDLGAEDGGEVS